nr:transporter substrate-binding domain-containing protein [uncultured Rhodoferax sp.]
MNTSDRPLGTPRGFVQDAVELALQKTAQEYGPYRIGFTERMNQVRALKQLESGAPPRLIIYTTFHNALLPRNIDYVRIPLDMGLTGIRVCFTHAGAEARIRNRPTPDTLKQLTIGVGLGWYDSNILRFNGFTVTEVPDTSRLLQMLAHQRFDMVCRGANELKPEYTREAAKLKLRLSSAALSYELPRALWVNKADQTTRKRLEKGLQLAHADGSLAALQKRHWARSLQIAALHSRKIFPLVTPEIDKLDPAFRRFDHQFEWSTQQGEDTRGPEAQPATLSSPP